MKKFRWIAALLAALLVCGIFSACENRKTPDGPGTEITSGGTEAPAAPNIIEADRTTRYFVVRGDRAAQTVVDAAVLLRNYFREIGVETTLTDDWEQNEQRSDYEILIGKTEREKPELYEPDRALLGKDGYIIHVVGTKIFLCGGSDEAWLR